MKRIIRYFFEGLMILIPIFVSVYVVLTVFRKIDGIFGFSTPGIGFALTIAIIVSLGALSSNFLTKKLISYVEGLFARLPLVKILYGSMKDLIGAFVGDKKSFTKPVLVTISAETGAKALGFVTRESLESLSLHGHVAVYLPHSYNFSGALFVYPKGMVEPVLADSSEFMAFIVSAGVSGSIEAKNQPTRP
ncbi:MAG TPA: DUF502 domain-containing protein [Thermodesulfobacteriota bacterium]|nr:DUF502 domain-containing protein [Thermodesulfobacteriota bacterium]